MTPLRLHHQEVGRECITGNPVDSATGLWRCWSDCGRGGDIIALEIALTGAAWFDAVEEIERIIGRPLLNRPTSQVERRALADNLARDRREMQNAEFWRTGARCMAEQILDGLPEAAPDRFAPTQLLMSLCATHGAVLLALYRDGCAIDVRLAAALVYAGERAWQRRCEALARFIAAGAEVKDTA